MCWVWGYERLVLSSCCFEFQFETAKSGELRVCLLGHCREPSVDTCSQRSQCSHISIRHNLKLNKVSVGQPRCDPSGVLSDNDILSPLITYSWYVTCLDHKIRADWQGMCCYCFPNKSGRNIISDLNWELLTTKHGELSFQPIEVCIVCSDHTVNCRITVSFTLQ